MNGLLDSAKIRGMEERLDLATKQIAALTKWQERAELLLGTLATFVVVDAVILVVRLVLR